MGREWNPNTAAWLVAQRGKRKQDEIVALLAERGQKVSRAWMSRIENGAPFSDELLAAFVDLYGSVPPPETRKDAPPEGEASLAEAIDRQTEAIKANTEMLSAVLQALAGPHLSPDGQRWAAERAGRPIQDTAPADPRPASAR